MLGFSLSSSLMSWMRRPSWASTARLISTSMAALMVARSGAAAAAETAAAVFAWRAVRTLSWLSCSARGSSSDLLSHENWLSRSRTR